MMKHAIFMFCLLFSVPAFAGSTFIVWPLAQDEAFRARYEQVVSEGIDPQPQAQTATHAMIGSSRITPEHIGILQDEFPAVVFTNDIPQDMQP